MNVQIICDEKLREV